MRYQPVTRFDVIGRMAVGFAAGPALLIWGIVMKSSHTVSCGDETLSPGEVCRDVDSGKTTTYADAANGDNGVATFLIVAGILVTIAALLWFAYRWQNRAARPLLPPKQPRGPLRGPRGAAPVKLDKFAWAEARLAENAQYGLAVRVDSERNSSTPMARVALRDHLNAHAGSDPVYARAAAALAAHKQVPGTPLPFVVSGPRVWFFVRFSPDSPAKEQLHALLDRDAPKIRTLLQNAAATESATVVVGS